MAKEAGAEGRSTESSEAQSAQTWARGRLHKKNHHGSRPNANRRARMFLSRIPVEYASFMRIHMLKRYSYASHAETIFTYSPQIERYCTQISSVHLSEPVVARGSRAGRVAEGAAHLRSLLSPLSRHQNELTSTDSDMLRRGCLAVGCI